MNLERRIRDSATAQAQRYRPAAHLTPRIEQRRRQRTARRLAMASTALAIVVVASAITVASRLDGGGAITPAVASAPTPATIVSTTVPAPAPTTLAPVVTGASPSTTASPATGAPVTAPSPPATLHSSTPPAFATRGAPVWTFGAFWNVPQLGGEPVRGTGCGSISSFDEIIPDGLWAGFVTSHSADAVAIDLLCVYPAANASALPSGSANVVFEAPDYVVVNNSTRARTMPMDSAIVLRLAGRDAGGNCVDSTSTDQWSDIAADQQVWMRIHDGRVTWLLADCR